MVWLRVCGWIRAGRDRSLTSGTAANVCTWQASHWCKNEWACVVEENEWMGKKNKKREERIKQKCLKKKKKSCSVLKSLPPAACRIRPEVAVLPLLFSLIDGTALLLTSPQEHFTCSVLIGPRPPC